jgi:hypothetical protein
MVIPRPSADYVTSGKKRKIKVNENMKEEVLRPVFWECRRRHRLTSHSSSQRKKVRHLIAAAATASSLSL